MMIMEYFLTCPTATVHDAYLKHIRVHALADMLNIDSLKILAVEKLWLSIRNNWDVRLFIPCVKETYATTNKRDKTIRNMLVMAAHKNMAQLVERKGFVEEFQDMGEFTVEFLVHVAPSLNSIVNRTSFGVLVQVLISQIAPPVNNSA